MTTTKITLKTLRRRRLYSLGLIRVEGLGGGVQGLGFRVSRV